MSVFYQGQDNDGSGWASANQTDDSDGSLKSKVLKSASKGLKSLSQPSSSDPASALSAAPSAPPPVPYTPNTGALEPMGSQMAPRVTRNPRLQQALLEA